MCRLSHRWATPSVGDAALEEKLPPLPLPERVKRALDRDVAFTLDDPTLAQAVQTLARAARIDIRLGPAALQAAGVTPGTCATEAARSTYAVRTSSSGPSGNSWRR